MSQRVDVLVVGAGIYGAAVAHEAVRRGASVLLLDRGDIAGGASSNSLKTAHGGLRYLQSLDLPRFFESIRERRRWLREATPWVAPTTFRMDMRDRGSGYRLLFRAGLALNDVLAVHRNRGVAPAKRLGRSRYPTWQDAVFQDPERILLSLLHSARAAGPGTLRVAPYRGVIGLITEAGRVIGAHLAAGGRVDCTHVIRCVGAHRAGERPVMAMNLLVPLLQLSKNAEAVVLAHPDEGRNVFVVPWRGHSMIGTWNRDYPGEAEAPFALRLEWIDEMLRWLTPVHPQLAALTRSDIRLVHAGLVPRAPGSREPEPASQTRLETPLPGLTDVVGVKWTTAWGVAIGVVERVLGKTADPEPVLARFHGDLARTATTEDALRFAVEAEWATHLDDVLLRRVQIAATGHPGTPRVEAASRFLQPLLDWSERERHSEVEAFHALPVFAGNIKAE